jgi:hypothetical protein
MATDIPSKSKINFDVYERADPSSQIDWGAQAKKIADTFTGIKDERQKQKAEIEKAFQDQQTALQDIGEYDNPTIQQFVMNGGQDVSNKLLDVQNLVQRGLMKPSDATMWQHNAKTGFDLLKKNASQYDKTFQEYTQRLQEQMEGSNLSVGAPGEEWMAKQLEGFANMNNMSLEADPETGNMVMLKMDENGQPIPGSSMSVQRMTLLMKQKIDNFDVGKATQGIKDELGNIITADLKSNGVTTEITSEQRSRAETEFFATEDGQKFLDLKAQQMLANPFNQQSMMVNANLTTSDGTEFEIGSQEDYDKWNEENGGNEENNPYLVMEFGEDNQYRPKFNDAQQKIAEEYAKNQITSSLDVKQEKDIKKTQKTTHAPRPKNQWEFEAGKEKENMLNMGKNVNLLTSGDPRQRKAAAEAIGAETGADIQVVIDANGVTQEFIITKPGKTAKRISAFAQDKTPLTVDELNRSIYEHAVEGSNYDQWLNAGGEVGENVGEGGVDVKQAGERIDYTPMAVTDVNEFLDLGDNLRYNSTSAILGKFDQMLTNSAFWPEGMKNIPKSVKEDGGNLVFTIGNETVSFPNKNDTSVNDIVTGVQELMSKVVNDANTGGGGVGNKYNK